jgi:hypothetical protein
VGLEASFAVGLSPCLQPSLALGPLAYLSAVRSLRGRLTSPYAPGVPHQRSNQRGSARDDCRICGRRRTCDPPLRVKPGPGGGGGQGMCGQART